MEKRILAVAGKPGLYMLVSRGRSALIVESIDEKKHRMPISFQDRITSLSDVSMYTTGEDVPLMQVLDNIKKEYNGAEVPIVPKKASKKELEDFMAKALPDYDTERVYQNDMRKLITWYNILVKNGITDFVTDEEKADAKDNAADAEAKAADDKAAEA